MCMDENELRTKRAKGIARDLKVDYVMACQLLLDAMKESKQARAVAA